MTHGRGVVVMARRVHQKLFIDLGRKRIDSPVPKYILSGV
jgi:hypothetical protein